MSGEQGWSGTLVQTDRRHYVIAGVSICKYHHAIPAKMLTGYEGHPLNCVWCTRRKAALDAGWPVSDWKDRKKLQRFRDKQKGQPC